MIIEKVDKYMESQIKQWPVRSNRAGEIGHPCLRYLVFLRTRGEERPLHDVRVQYIFREGQDQEKAILRLLADANIEVVEQQRTFEWKEYQITGKVDGKIIEDGEILPMEIKSMSPYAFDKIHTVQDMFNSNYVYMQKYPGQLTSYLMMDEKERGLFLLKNKTTGRLKEIILPLDYAYGETLLKKAEVVNQCLADKTVPEPMPWCDICDKQCDFRFICLQEALREEIQFVVDPDAEEKIDGWFELKQWKDKWADLDEWKKEHFRGINKIVVGPYLITGKATAKGWTTKITKI